MDIPNKARDEVMRILSEAGATGATITEVEAKSKYERHTLSKYLSMMQAHGLIARRNIGKAKLWMINQAPLETVLNTIPENRTFTETVLSRIISSLPCGLFVIDREYQILFMNSPMWGAYGQKKGEYFYKAILGLENPLKLRKVTELIEGNQEKAELTIQDLHERTLHIKATRLQTADKGVNIILMVEDITDRRRVQEEVLTQKALLEGERQALNEAAIVAETDLEGKITYVNDQFVKVSGYERHELLGKTHRVINSGLHPPEFWKAMWKTIKSGKVWRGIIRNKAKDGSFYWVDSSIAPVLGKSGKPVKYLAIRFEITKYMNAKEKKA
ncbi:MAG: PAS domain S-box protein [Nanoarchaeota archaeon]|nr:PAS domain S-box protein [Nanoarchaeota archaeon]